MRSFFIFQKKNNSIKYEIALYLLIFWDQKQLCCLSDGIWKSGGRTIYANIRQVNLGEICKPFPSE